MLGSWGEICVRRSFGNGMGPRRGIFCLATENGAVLCGVVVAVVVHMRQGTGDGPTGCCADGSGVLPRGLLVTLPWWFLPWVICMSALPRHSIVTITRTCVCVCVE